MLDALKISILSIVAAVVTSGCQAPIPAATGTPFQPVSFRCPSAGTVVTYSGGNTANYAGTDPNDPHVCLVRVSHGHQRWLFNLKQIPRTGEEAIRNGLQALWPLELGRQTHFSFIGRAGQETYQYRETWRVLRAEPMSVGTTTRNTIVISQTQEGITGNTYLGTNTYWIDVETGADLRRVVQVVRGSTGDRNFHAVGISVPPR